MCEIKIKKKKKNEISSNEHPLIRDFRIFFFYGEQKKREREKSKAESAHLMFSFRFDEKYVFFR